MVNQTINVTVGTLSINVTLNTTITNITNPDGKLLLDGPGGDSYFIYNSTTNRVELYVDGNKRSEWG